MPPAYYLHLLDVLFFFFFIKYKKLETRVLEEFHILLLFGIAHFNQLHTLQDAMDDRAAISKPAAFLWSASGAQCPWSS